MCVVFFFFCFIVRCETSYLKRAQNQVKNKPQLSLHLLGDEREHDEIDPKQGDQEQRRFGQPPETTKRIQIQMSPLAKTSFNFHFLHLSSEDRSWRGGGVKKNTIKKLSVGKALMHYSWLMRYSSSQEKKNSSQSCISLLKAAASVGLLCWLQ